MIATLASVPLCDNQVHTWRMTPGVRPYQTVVECPEAAAESILSTRGAPVTYRIESVEVRDVYVLGSTAGTQPWSVGILISDKRWLWARSWVQRDYNLRRRTGDARLVGEGNFRVETAPLAQDVAYASWSVRNGKPWGAAEVLADVFASIGVNAVVPRVERTILVEDLTLNHPGDVAIAATLSFLAGYQVTVDLSGRVRVYDSRDGAEASVVAAAGPAGVDTGSWRVADRSRTRPSKVVVLFDREPEVRFDLVEGERPSRTMIRGEEPRKLENVIAVPDVTIQIGNRTVTQGSIVEMTEYLEALVGKEPPSAPGPLTHAQIRYHWLMMWDYVVAVWGRDAAGNADPVWLKRINAIRRSWRQLFRPLPEWREKVRSFRAYRAAIVDVESRARAPSEAFMDWVAMPSHHGIARRASQNTAIGYQIDGWAALLEDGRAAPARVTIVDEDQGLFRVDLVRDALGDVESLAPGQVDRLPSLALRDCDAGEARVTWQTSRLTDTFRLAVVLTCLQAAPNSVGRMHAVEVSPGDAARALGRNVGACRGEPYTVAVGGGLVTARTAWVDALADKIEGAFYRGEPYPDLLVNRDQIQAVAIATAARVYETYLDRVQGSFQVAMNPDVQVAGAISEVTHSLAPDGAQTTTIEVAPELQDAAPEALIPASMQRIIRGMVQP